MPGDEVEGERVSDPIVEGSGVPGLDEDGSKVSDGEGAIVGSMVPGVGRGVGRGGEGAGDGLRVVGLLLGVIVGRGVGPMGGLGVGRVIGRGGGGRGTGWRDVGLSVGSVHSAPLLFAFLLFRDGRFGFLLDIIPFPPILSKIFRFRFAPVAASFFFRRFILLAIRFAIHSPLSRAIEGAGVLQSTTRLLLPFPCPFELPLPVIFVRRFSLVVDLLHFFPPFPSLEPSYESAPGPDGEGASLVLGTDHTNAGAMLVLLDPFAIMDLLDMCLLLETLPFPLLVEPSLTAPSGRVAVIFALRLRLRRLRRFC